MKRTLPVFLLVILLVVLAGCGPAFVTEYEPQLEFPSQGAGQ